MCNKIIQILKDRISHLALNKPDNYLVRIDEVKELINVVRDRI